MDLFDQAMQYASVKHHGQVRKRSNLPYILHPMEAATIAATLTNDLEVIAAAVLHDTVEDANADPAEIKELFGDRVAALVASETENKYPDQPAAETWYRRKEESLAVLKSADDIGVKIVWLSDKLANMRSYARQYRRQGSAMWEHYHQSDPEAQEWYYRQIAEGLADLSDTDAYYEYCLLLEYIFKSEESK